MKNTDDRWEDVYLSNVNILSGIRPAGRTTDHRTVERSLHGLLYIWSGEARFYEGNDKETVATVGDLLYIPKRYKYKMHYSADATTFVLVNFDIKSKDGEDMSLSENISVLLNDKNDSRVASIMSTLEVNSAVGNPVTSFRRKELVYKLFGIIFEGNAALTFKDRKYAAIFEGALLLQQTYLEDIPVTEFARASNISVSSFRALFTEQYGCSPLQYRNRMRINRARSILEEGSCTVAEAAYASGFENIGYFCRYYKKITGETPSETRSRNF